MSTPIKVLNFESLVPPGATGTCATGINNHDQIVGHFTEAGGATHGFLCVRDSFTQVDYPNAKETLLLGINDLGQMVGQFANELGTFGFFYDRETFSPPLTFPDAGNFTNANAINDRAEIIGTYQTPTAPGEHSFLYKGGEFQMLVYPGAKETGVDGIDNSGQIVGNFPDAQGTHGFVYLENAGLFTPAVSYPKRKVTVLRAINNGGQIVGGAFDPNGVELPFLFIAASPHPILIPNAAGASVNDINDRGQIVGNFPTETGAHAFVASVPT
jgi:uncharacterized membrane protein